MKTMKDSDRRGFGSRDLPRCGMGWNHFLSLRNWTRINTAVGLEKPKPMKLTERKPEGMNIKTITEHEAEQISTPTETVRYVFAYRMAEGTYWGVLEGWPTDAPLEEQLNSVFGSWDKPIAEVRVFKIRLPIIAMPHKPQSPI